MNLARDQAYAGLVDVQVSLSLAQDVQVKTDAQHIIVVRPGIGAVQFHRSALANGFIDAMTEQGEWHEPAAVGVDHMAAMYFMRDALSAQGLLIETLWMGNARVASFRFAARPVDVPPLPATGRLKEFVSISPGEHGLVLATAGNPARMTLSDPRIIDFVTRLSLDGVAASGLDSLSKETVMDWLRRAGAFAPSAVPCAPTTWSPMDLTFHLSSRKGDLEIPYGATFPFRGRIEEPPAIKPIPPGSLPLPRPDLAAVERADRSFTNVLEARQSIREHAACPLPFAKLGEFLYRAARVRERIQAQAYEIARRPYPAGGALYELELYLLPTACDQLEQAMYWYDPLNHALAPIDVKQAWAAHALVDEARATAQTATPPQLLIIIAARFPRVRWKYSTMAYSLTLKHVGVLMQTMYLVAESMGLAACALGGGSAANFALATGLDVHEEGSVGEFILGVPASTRT